MLLPHPLAENAGSFRIDDPLFVRVLAVLALLVFLWLVVIALGFAAEAASWVADTLRGRGRRSERPERPGAGDD